MREVDSRGGVMMNAGAKTCVRLCRTLALYATEPVRAIDLAHAVRAPDAPPAPEHDRPVFCAFLHASLTCASSSHQYCSVPVQSGTLVAMNTRKLLALLLSCLAITLLSGFAQDAHADFLYRDYKALLQRFGDKTGPIDMHVVGLGEGILSLHYHTISRGGAPTFCVPPKLGLGLANFRDMIETGAQQLGPGQADQFPLGILLLGGLQATFPCEKQ